MNATERWSVPALSWQGVLLALLVCIFSFVLRAWQVGSPPEVYFDETYYGPAAIEYIEGKADSNTVHPPLGKLQIAAGILGMRALNSWCGSEVFDEHVQRRATSIICGVLMVAFTFMLGYRISRGSRQWALLAEFLVAIDFMAVAMSRVCMLDIINSLWIIIGIYCCWRYLESCWNESPRRNLWAVLCALALAISTASKWNGLFATGACWLAMVFFRDASWAVNSTFGFSNGSDSERDEFGSGLGGKTCSCPHIKDIIRNGWKPGLLLAILFAVVTSIVYLASYLPLFLRMGFGADAWKEIWGYHTLMVEFRYDAKQFTHGYISYFWEWPLVLRPIWMYFETKPDGVGVNGIVSFGSVIFWWPALIYLLESLYYGCKNREGVRLFLALMWVVQWLLWASSTTGGFIYYMLPIVPIMALVAAGVIVGWLSEGGTWMALLYIAALAAFFVGYWPFISGEDTTMSVFARMFPAWATRWR